MKKVLCFLFSILMVFSLVACNEGNKPSDNSNNNVNSNVNNKDPNSNNIWGNENFDDIPDSNGTTSTPVQIDTTLKKGEVKPLGDVFELPNIKQSAGAPVISEISKHAYPGDSIIVAGEGFKKTGVKFYVYSQSEKDNGKSIEAKFTLVDDNYASVLIDEDLEYGIYGVYAKDASGTSAIKTVNKPSIWNIGVYKLTSGQSLTVLGENLTTDNGKNTTAYLVSEDGKEYAQVSVAFADAGKVEIIIPDTLKKGQKYKVLIHNGHGGKEGFAESESLMEYLDKPAVEFGGKILNIVDYGADPKALGNDDSVALKKLISELNDGDTIYFPPGSYLLSSKVTISKSVRILGAGADKTKIFAGYNISGGALEIRKGPCEITGICFEQKRTTGKLKGYFVDYKSPQNETGVYGLYFHANAVIQSVTAKSRSSNFPVNVNDSYGIIVEDNYFNATGMLQVYGAKKVYLRNNTAIMNIYCGLYYQFANALFTNVEFLDVSNNIVTGGGAPEECSGELVTDSLAAGRVFACQGWAHNTYISHNKIRRAGISTFGAGEIIMYENIEYRLDGDVKSSTSTVTTLDPLDKNEVKAGNVITIISGKGRGQYRKVKLVAGNNIEVDKAWDIIPDETSHVLVNHGFLNAFVCYNDIDGHTNWQEVPSSTMGLQAYGNIHNMFYSFNVVKNTSFGIEITPFYYNNITAGQESNARCVIAWSYFDRNRLENVGRGISMTITTSGNDKNAPVLGEIAFGNSIRKNTIKDVLDFATSDKKGSGGAGIRMGPTTSNWTGNWCVANLFEANDLSNCVAGDIVFNENQANNVFRNNTNGGKKAGMKIPSQKLGPIETKY